MAVPRRRTSKTAKRKRRTHFKLTAAGTSQCSHCGQQKPQHHVCPHCGYYNDREIVVVAE